MITVKHRMLSFGLAAFCGLLFVGTRGEAVDFYVNTTADLVDLNPGDGICDADPGAAEVCSLRAAIQEANALPNQPSEPAPGNLDRIGIYGGTYTLTLSGRDEDAAATGDLDLTETVQIFGDPGNRPILDGGGIDRVFDFLAPTGSVASILDVVIRNGSAEGDGLHGSGGGVRCFSPGTILVGKTILHDNTADFFGGGLHNEGCEFYLSESLVESNSALEAGGGVGSRFGNLILSESTVRGNSTGPSGSGATTGGGIFATSGVPDDFVYISQSSIVDNGADWGAGIDSGMRLYLINSVVAENQGSYGGGGGLRSFGELTLSSSTIYGNSTTGTSYAAGLYLQGGSASATMDHTILAGNTNGSGASDCSGVSIVSDGYNLIGSSSGCTITGTMTGNLLDVDPQLVGPILRPLAAGTAGGRPAWMPASGNAPPVDAGNPAGSTFDHDANSATADVANTEDQWDDDRPFDGDGDTNARVDIGAIELSAILVDNLESSTFCYWSASVNATPCP